VYGRPIGQWASFCTNKKCKIQKHRKQNWVDITEGNLYVYQTQNTAFMSPTISSFALEDDIIVSWLKESKSLSSWNQQFRLATNDSSNGVATFKSLEEEEYDNQTSREFKTPKRKKMNDLLLSAKTTKYEQLID